jgi:chemotaxis protein CheD
MKIRMLHINEFDVSDQPLVYTCFGLGSCIGLFIVDRVKKISGGAHIPLPSSLNEGTYLGAPQMIDLLLKSFGEKGSDLTCLSAKLAGGANMYASSLGIGDQNANVVQQLLISKRIFISAMDVGGKVSRTARFNSATGALHIYTSEQKTYCI